MAIVLNFRIDELTVQVLDAIQAREGCQSRSHALRTLAAAIAPSLGLQAPAASPRRSPEAEAAAFAKEERKQFLDLRKYPQDIRLALRHWIETGELPPKGYSRLPLVRRLEGALKAAGQDHPSHYVVFWATEELPIPDKHRAAIAAACTPLELKLLGLAPQPTATPKAAEEK